MYDSIIFDLDGTLWDSTENVASAFRELLDNKYPEVTDEVTADKLRVYLDSYWMISQFQLFKSVPADKAIAIMDECCEYECEYLEKHGATLFDGIEETIKKLHKNYALYRK